MNSEIFKYIIMLLVPIIGLAGSSIFIIYLERVNDSINKIKNKYMEFNEVTLYKGLKYFIIFKAIATCAFSIIFIATAIYYSCFSKDYVQAIETYILLIAIILCFLYYFMIGLYDIPKKDNDLIYIKGKVIEADIDDFTWRLTYGRRARPILMHYVTIENYNSEKVILKTYISFISVGDNIEAYYTEKLKFIYRLKKEKLA